MVLVDYLVARDGLPSRIGLAYDYILAGDGLFVTASNQLLRVRIPVARCSVRGLDPVFAACTLVHGRVPAICGTPFSVACVLRALRIVSSCSEWHMTALAISWSCRGNPLVRVRSNTPPTMAGSSKSTRTLMVLHAFPKRTPRTSSGCVCTV
jgi:hypothetical protein